MWPPPSFSYAPSHLQFGVFESPLCTFRSGHSGHCCSGLFGDFIVLPCWDGDGVVDEEQDNVQAAIVRTVLAV